DRGLQPKGRKGRAALVHRFSCSCLRGSRAVMGSPGGRSSSSSAWFYGLDPCTHWRSRHPYSAALDRLRASRKRICAGPRKRSIELAFRRLGRKVAGTLDLWWVDLGPLACPLWQSLSISRSGGRARDTWNCGVRCHVEEDVVARE